MSIVDERFAPLAMPKRVWVVPSIYGAVDQLCDLHGQITAQFRPGDRLVYTGNYLGYGDAIIDTIDELLRVRRHLIAGHGVFAGDIVYLRGQQEEIWQKMLMLHFAPQPNENLAWMLANGAAATLADYGGDGTRAMAITREGAVAIAKWTNQIRSHIRQHPGHEKFFTVLRRAAFTHYRRHWPDAAELLFVHAGFDPHKPLSAQGDALWWGYPGFDDMVQPYLNFGRIVRGHDPSHPGLRINPITATVDGGCGPAGGPLLSVCFTSDGTAETHVMAPASMVGVRAFA